MEVAQQTTIQDVKKVIMHSPDLRDYKQFFDETPVALIRTDINSGQFLMANLFAAKMFGYESPEELQHAATILDFYSKSDRKKLINEIKKNGVLENHLVKLKLLSGKDLWVSARLRINCGGTCIEGSLIDVTKYLIEKEVLLEKQNELSKKLDSKLTALAS
jgi:PAS domain-containing protein